MLPRGNTDSRPTSPTARHVLRAKPLHRARALPTDTTAAYGVGVGVVERIDPSTKQATQSARLPATSSRTSAGTLRTRALHGERRVSEARMVSHNHGVIEENVAGEYSVSKVHLLLEEALNGPLNIAFSKQASMISLPGVSSNLLAK